MPSYSPLRHFLLSERGYLIQIVRFPDVLRARNLLDHGEDFEWG